MARIPARIDLPRSRLRGGPRGLPGPNDLERVSLGRDPGVQVPDMGASFGRALQGTGGQVAEAIERQQKRQDAIKLSEALIAYQQESTEALTAFQQEADPTDFEYLQKFQQERAGQAEKFLTEHGNNLLTEEARTRFHVRIQEATADAVSAAQTVHLKAQQAKVGDLAEQRINTIGRQAEASPEAFDALLGEADSLLQDFEIGGDEAARILTPEQERAFLRQARTSVVAGAVTGMVVRGDFAAAEDFLQRDDLDDVLDLGMRDALRQRIKQGRTAAVGRVKYRLRDHLESIRVTGQGIPGFEHEVSTLPPEAAEQAQRDIQQARTFHNAISAIRFAAPEEIEETLVRMRPPPGAPDFANKWQDFETARNAVGRTLRERAADPAGYAMQVPAVQEAFESGDFEEALAIRLEVQRGMGLPRHMVRTLTEDEANGIAAEVMAAPTNERAAHILALQERYGRHWDKAFAELMNAGLDNRTEVLGMVANNPALSQTVAQVIETGTVEMKKGLDAAAVNDLEARVDAELGEFRQVVAARDLSGGLTGRVNGLARVVKDLAIHYYRQGVSDPERRAAQQIIFNQVQPVDSPQMKALLPRFLDGQPINAAHVEAVAESRLTREALEEFGTAPFGDINDTPQFLNRERTIRSALNSGYWVTNETNDGLVLMVPFRSGGVLPLVNEKGERFEIDLLDAMAAPFPTVEGPFGLDQPEQGVMN